MDAAKYISTLDGIGVLRVEPSRANFAVIDLAVDDRFLQFLYEANHHGAIQWRSLLEGTRWQSAWHRGPILLEFAADPGFLESLKARLSALSLGILIDAPESPGQVFNWAQAWVMALSDSDERLFRFYDPRSFRPLLATLGDKSRSLVNSGVTLYWNHRDSWHAWGCEAGNEPEELPTSFRLSAGELRELPRYRMADRAIDYADLYRNQLFTEGDPRIWVLEQLQDASGVGFRSAAQQERWLRLRLRSNAPLLTDPEYKSIIDAPEMTPADRLMAMESKMESARATA